LPRRAKTTTQTDLISFSGDRGTQQQDELATEEPLEIRIHYGGDFHTAAVTMRTPGHDFELAAGFLRTEGIIASREDILDISYCLESEAEPEQRFNIVNVVLHPELQVDLTPLQRHFIMSSACGVCGKASLDALKTRDDIVLLPGGRVTPALLYDLPKRLEAAQSVFQQTGGLHAAALFDSDGALVELREDVGRHNALDKLIGWALTNDRLPLHHHMLLVSGRASFELLQKSVVAGISIFCAVSAPSSLAVDLAETFGVTLVGFLRKDRFNIYTNSHRVETGEA
jgi:FdhD protein